MRATFVALCTLFSLVAAGGFEPYHSDSHSYGVGHHYRRHDDDHSYGCSSYGDHTHQGNPPPGNGNPPPGNGGPPGNPPPGNGGPPGNPPPGNGGPPPGNPPPGNGNPPPGNPPPGNPPPSNPPPSNPPPSNPPPSNPPPSNPPPGTGNPPPGNPPPGTGNPPPGNGNPPPGNPPPGNQISQCNTGPVQCCNSVQHAKSASVRDTVSRLSLLGITDILNDVTGQVGLTCNPISVIGIGGNSCSSQPVCCSNNSFNGVIALGCTPINVNL